jgi:hypothetical protein
VNPAEIEVGNLQGHRKAVIPQNFAVPEGLSGESAVEQAQAQIVAFKVIHSHSGLVRMANARDAFNELQLDGIFASG